MPDVNVKKSGSVYAPNTFVNVHIVIVCSFSYLLIPGARLYAERTAVFLKIILFKYIEILEFLQIYTLYIFRNV